MIKYLENLLFEKTNGTQSEILYAKWKYDKQIIPPALNAVYRLFPHYSLHDESHSLSIINNIIRILGEDKIQKLSAIDIWLILEASYLHDIGMAVSSGELEITINKKDFLIFFKDIKENKKHSLNEFASQFEIVDEKINYNTKNLNLEYHDGIKYILAEYYRKQHGHRSKEIINDNNQELSINLPKAIIPKRILGLLSEICSCHTKSFDEVMQLPQIENGIETEHCHPRFISFLLRIGDLLDIDNNRFSEVMLSTLSKIPKDTIIHKNKHLSIKAFSINNEIINIKAQCDDYETAQITQHWFDFIKSELTEQILKWNKIEPFKNFGYLPSIGELKVEIKDYEYLDEFTKPKFSVDIEKAMDLFRGTNIYSDKLECIREVLQNAADATLLRLWLEYKEYNYFDEPNNINFNEKIKKYPINIKIQEQKQDEKQGQKVWLISIEDQGIGISKEDLKFLIKIGSSSKNKEKNREVEEMPKWLRPSGNFGIGFQSIFMITNKVVLETKSYFTKEAYQIELFSPNSMNDGGVLIKKIKPSYHFKPFTKFQFEYKTELIPKRWQLNDRHKKGLEILRDYDPFLNPTLDLDITKIIDEIIYFFEKSNIPLTLSINGINKNELIETNNTRFSYFSKSKSLEFDIWTHLKVKSNRSFINIYFKNQPVENRYRLNFLYINVNIHNYKASDILSLNREKIRDEMSNQLYQDIIYSLFEIITINFDSLFEDDQNKAYGSMFLQYYYSQYHELLKEFDIKKFNQWKNFKVIITDVSNSDKPAIPNEETFNDLLNKIETLKVDQNDMQTRRDDYFELNNKVLSIYLANRGLNNDPLLFIVNEFNKTENYIEIKKIELRQKILVFYKNKPPDFNEDFDKQQTELILKDILNSSLYNERYIITCHDKYHKLRLKKDANKAYLKHYCYNYDICLYHHKMLSPFIEKGNSIKEKHYTEGLNEDLFQWVYDNRLDSETTLDEIKKGYHDFISDFKELLNNTN
ncbi:MAG: ATP-binding protein [Alphaproteobacteria bacterium]|nr:ATP-binding protein [Alphaproteobacteria bacterium]